MSQEQIAEFVKNNVVKKKVESGVLTRADFLRRLPSQVEEIITTNKGIEYYNTPCAFDIETTSFKEGDEKRAIMYHWQFEFNNIVTFGRTWTEFIELLEQIHYVLNLQPNQRVVVYVHNLQYEWGFMHNWFDWDDIFFLDKGKPATAITGNFEFRDSLVLAGGKGLAKIGEDLQHHDIQKMVGDLDYSKIRHSGTELTPAELKYCENDVRVLCAYIAEKIEQDGDITRIPMTNTGYVRRFLEESLLQ